LQPQRPYALDASARATEMTTPADTTQTKLRVTMANLREARAANRALRADNERLLTELIEAKRLLREAQPINGLPPNTHANPFLEEATTREAADATIGREPTHWMPLPEPPAS
jgi:hypothetical protein